MPVRSSVFLFGCGAGYLERRHRSKTRVPRATVDNARIDAIGIVMNAVVAAEIVIATSAVVAVKIVIEIETAIVTATNANRVKPPKKLAIPSRRRSKHLAATPVAVGMARAVRAVAAKVKDVAAVGMISVVVSRVVRTAASVRLHQAPRLLRRLWPLLRPQRRHRLPLRRSWALQT
jgi:hypothetical protein